MQILCLLGCKSNTNFLSVQIVQSGTFSSSASYCITHLQTEFIHSAFQFCSYILHDSLTDRIHTFCSSISIQTCRPYNSNNDSHCVYCYYFMRSCINSSVSTFFKVLSLLLHFSHWYFLLVRFNLNSKVA